MPNSDVKLSEEDYDDLEIIWANYLKKLSVNLDMTLSEEEKDSSKNFWFATNLKWVQFLITIVQKTVTTLSGAKVWAPEMTNQAVVITAIRLLLNYSHETFRLFLILLSSPTASVQARVLRDAPTNTPNTTHKYTNNPNSPEYSSMQVKALPDAP